MSSLGLAAGAVVIPRATAYATVADLPVQVGLYTCMVPMAVCALIGGSRTLSVSTTSTVAILTASTLAAADVAAGSRDPARALAMLTLLLGVILLVARLLRLRALIDNISEATLTGIKVGVGLTVAAGQLPKLLGIPGNPSADNFFSEMRAVFDQVDRVSWTTVAFSAATIAVLVGLRRLVPRIPGPLVAVGGGIVLVAATSIDKHGLALIARVPSGRPSPIAPSFAHFGALLPGAFAIAIMVFLETLAVARSVRRASEPAIDNNQELVASGLSWAFPRPRSTSAPAPEPNSASSSPSGSRSHVRCFSAACSAIFPIGWAVELADEPHLDLWRAIPTRGRLMTLCQPIARARVRTCRLSAASSPGWAAARAGAAVGAVDGPNRRET